VTPSIVLSGPPGVGKSEVGRLVAARLGTQAIDLDRAIEQRTSRTPAAIIRGDGEAAFRAVEADTLETLDPAYRVVALGGGTLTTKRGRKAARARGAVLGLEADVSTLIDRVGKSTDDRPLSPDPARLTELVASRRRTYAAVDRRVSAEADPNAVAERVVESASALELVFADVGGARSRIVIGDELADAAAGAVAALEPTRPVLAIVDRGVPSARVQTYLDRVSALFPIHVEHVAGGEAVKTWTFLGQILENALAHGCGRQSAVLAIGGGATCDLAALAASLLGRGAPCVLVPTTLLAQVDASIGGKCAVNMNAGRNLVGAFHAASDVIVDATFLDSLDPREYRSGLAELLKIAIIAGGALFEDVARAPRATRTHIAAGIRAKAAIVARDPFERGERKLLNLGHTLGHALESASAFSLAHGEAVAIGMAAACRYSAARGLLPKATAARIIEVLAAVGLPVTASADLLNKSTAFIKQDKKADDAGFDVICIHELGKVSTKRVSLDEIMDLVRMGGTIGGDT
jgi:shikimate kinase / 3-dehydroquinate synthase